MVFQGYTQMLAERIQLIIVQVRYDKLCQKYRIQNCIVYDNPLFLRLVGNKAGIKFRVVRYQYGICLLYTSPSPRDTR